MPRAELEVELAAPAHLRPHYADDFRCLASACTENCCNGWTIPVDRATYESYREHPVLKPFAQSLIVLNPRSRSTGDFASMPLSHQGTCAFLDPQSLCGIHKHFGAPMLSAACASYPREPAEIAGAHEASLSLSCPEAARLTLLNPSLLSDIPAPLTKELPPDFQPTLALRDLSLKLLADRTFPLWQRLHRLGELARRLESLSHPKPAREWAQSHPTTVAHFIAEFTATAPPLSQHEDSTTLQLEFITEVLRTRLADPPVPPRFLEASQAFAAGLAWSLTEPILSPETTRRYTEARALFLNPLLEAHPHLLENFLANHLFKYQLPLGRPSAPGTAPSHPTAEHRTLTLFAAVVQTMLAGVAAHHREAFSTTHVLHLIQGFSKAIEHRHRSVEDLTRIAGALKLDHPGGLTHLLRPGDFLSPAEPQALPPAFHSVPASSSCAPFALPQS